MKDPIYNSKIFTAETIAASGTLENSSAPLVFGPKIAKGNNVGRNGEFNLWLKLTGNGTLKAQAKCSGNDGVDYVTIVPEIETGLVAGNYLISFSLPLCTQFTILLTETGGANQIVVAECNVISR